MAVIGLLAITGGYSLYQAVNVSYINVDADDSYYIYGQTYRDLMQPIQQVLDQVKADPKLKKTMRIQVVSAFTWPLPFLLGEISQAGYYTEQNTPEHLDADYLFVDELLDPKFAPRITGNYSRKVYRARQWASPMVFYSRVTAIGK